MTQSALRVVFPAIGRRVDPVNKANKRKQKAVVLRKGDTIGVRNTLEEFVGVRGSA